jgi:phosphopantetheine adenylyltransferase
MFEDIAQDIDYEQEYKNLKEKNEKLKEVIKQKDNNIVHTDRKLAEYISDCDNLSKIIRGIRKRMDDPKEFDDMVLEIADEYESVKEFIGEYDND